MSAAPSAEWSKDTILAFIEDYHHSPELWNFNHTRYADAAIRAETTIKLAAKYNCEVWELKKKIKNLRSAFHREHKKLSTLKKRGPKWFAYDRLCFLLNGAKHQDCDKSEDERYEESNNEDSLELSVHQFIKSETIMLPSLEENEETEPESVAKKRKRSQMQMQNPLEEDVPYEQEDKPKWFQERDACATYGEHVGNEIRNLKSKAQIHVKHLINNILYEAAMGKYDK
ncbi:uncharacterized protein LOC109599427 [Aethina tumida]|uniref:uncharacterized protein LOC109599427 n=1 Tax=Aethina tumida TaxID=116153 RepID=UPI00096B3C70|nr:uncharacterized protein LOC109599427 [Aethina tumida]